MKNRNEYLVFGLIFIVFTVIAFVAPFSKTPVFWTEYLSGLVALCFQIPLWNKSLKEGSLKSRFLGFPLLYIGGVYLIVQLIIALIMMAFSNISVWIAIIVNLIILAIACILVISGDVARAAIHETESQINSKTSYLKVLKADVDILISEESDPEVKQQLTKLADNIRYSDPMSDESLDEIETQIVNKVAAIASAGDNKLSLISEINRLIENRNIKCKVLK